MCGKVVGSWSRIHRSGFDLFKRRTMALVKRMFSTRSEWPGGRRSIERRYRLLKTIISGHRVEGTWSILRMVGAMPFFVPRFQSSQGISGKLSLWIARTLGSLSMTKRTSKLRKKSREASKILAFCRRYRFQDDN